MVFLNKLEDTQGVIRRRKNIQYNDRQKRDTKIVNGRITNTQKTKDRVTRTHLKKRDRTREGGKFPFHL